MVPTIASLVPKKISLIIETIIWKIIIKNNNLFSLYIWKSEKLIFWINKYIIIAGKEYNI